MANGEGEGAKAKKAKGAKKNFSSPKGKGPRDKDHHICARVRVESQNELQRPCSPMGETWFGE